MHRWKLQEKHEMLRWKLMTNDMKGMPTYN